ncbi:CocE/NonD family hydrolase [Jiangella ureilytica]|uniref:CocE/NonD family hydrolase n=1 Tax=Jiangella ureilytica TaxID=2530374 RepID=A0A4V2XXH7_9ACTN|nr:CocE/NonD family hydrolase [Jiangella ureilytica]TDC53275.1 CocE/NonD family hydrolase [Jiangella ureilytica]
MRTLERLLAATASGTPEPRFDADAIRRETVRMAVRDGTLLATDVYLPPTTPAPAVALRTPYGRDQLGECLLVLARRGYVVVAQDCRGTGDSEPDHWDFMVHEREDSVDLVDWITRQDWYSGFVGALGGSYAGWMQWCMALHPAMSALAPEVAGFGVGRPGRGPNSYLFVNSYSRSVGKGADQLALGYEETERRMRAETLAGGWFNEPMDAPFSAPLLDRYPQLRTLPADAAQEWLWERYRTADPAGRASLVTTALGGDRVTYQDLGRWSGLFPHRVGDGYLFPRAVDGELYASLRTPALNITGWYDWGLDYTLATWERLTRLAPQPVRSRSRLLITPAAHNQPGYHEGRDDHPELDRVYRTAQILDLLDHWYTAVREDRLDDWPAVVYYLMGANEWRSAPAWPPPEAAVRELYLGAGGVLTTRPPGSPSAPDRYTYDPADPTPTVGGSLVSSVYLPGSVDVAQVQARPDVLTYTTEPLERDLDVAGPLRLVLYASSSAVDTDFSARLSDVFPDGRAIQLQSATLRTRFRDPGGAVALLEPGRVYRLDVDLWATANRFRAGHRIRLDVTSSDFPRFDRNTNRGGEPGPPVRADQAVYHDPARPSRLVLSVLPGGE